MYEASMRQEVPKIATWISLFRCELSSFFVSKLDGRPNSHPLPTLCYFVHIDSGRSPHPTKKKHRAFFRFSHIPVPLSSASRLRLSFSQLSNFRPPIFEFQRKDWTSKHPSFYCLSTFRVEKPAWTRTLKI